MGWRPFVGPVTAVLPPGNADVRVIRDAMTDVELAVRSRSPVKLRLARWYFPGWEARVNGTRIALSANDGGSFDIAVPRGESRVVCRYRAPRLCYYAWGVSLAAAVLWIILLAVSRRRG